MVNNILKIISNTKFTIFFLIFLNLHNSAISKHEIKALGGLLSGGLMIRQGLLIE
jgi:hypothetical protein